MPMRRFALRPSLRARSAAELEPPLDPPDPPVPVVVVPALVELVVPAVELVVPAVLVVALEVAPVPDDVPLDPPLPVEALELVVVFTTTLVPPDPPAPPAESSCEQAATRSIDNVAVTFTPRLANPKSWHECMTPILPARSPVTEASTYLRRSGRPPGRKRTSWGVVSSEHRSPRLRRAPYAAKL
jgi:hypothetical protein